MPRRFDGHRLPPGADAYRRLNRRECRTAIARCRNVPFGPGLFSRIPQVLRAREGLLPIDAKFPHDSFERVVAAAEAGNPAEDFLLAPKFT
jgi:hypothetical protein